MRLTWSTFLLIALASTADALVSYQSKLSYFSADYQPAERRQLLSGLGDLLSGNQGQLSAVSSSTMSLATGLILSPQA